MIDIQTCQQGTLHVITGGMKAKKTPHFIHTFDNLRYTTNSFQLFKPRCHYNKELHERFGFPRNWIVSRTGLGIEAVEVDDTNPLDILNKLRKGVQYAGIEEITLFEQGDLVVEVIRSLLNQEKVVVVSGLDKNFRGEPFHPMPVLMTLATTVEKYYGICDINGCNCKGEYPQRIIDGKPAHYDSPIKVVGIPEAYQIRCFRHHEVPGKPSIEDILQKRS